MKVGLCYDLKRKIKVQEAFLFNVNGNTISLSLKQSR